MIQHTESHDGKPHAQLAIQAAGLSGSQLARKYPSKDAGINEPSSTGYLYARAGKILLAMAKDEREMVLKINPGINRLRELVARGMTDSERSTMILLWYARLKRGNPQ